VRSAEVTSRAECTTARLELARQTEPILTYQSDLSARNHLSIISKKLPKLEKNLHKLAKKLHKEAKNYINKGKSYIYKKAKKLHKQAKKLR